jgi:hypothetical protein
MNQITEAKNILDWAYGNGARLEFTNRMAVGQRAGQAFMNALYMFDRPEYNRLSRSTVDPFHDDSKLPAAMDKLTSK